MSSTHAMILRSFLKVIYTLHYIFKYQIITLEEACLFLKIMPSFRYVMDAAGIFNCTRSLLKF